MVDALLGRTGAASGPGGRATAAGFPLVAIAAALWGTDALFRRGLALELPATTVVVWEHLILTAVMLPVLFRVPWRKLTKADVVSLVLIGAGASALATGMFTAAFRYGDPNTPLLLQKLQPLVAILGARLLLGERLTPRFGTYLLVAVASAWLITFPDPFQVRATQATAGLLAAGAAALWAMGTVLGRRMSDRLTTSQLTAARFGIGLPAALLFALVGPGRADSLAIGGQDVVPLVLLALIPGLLALWLYYRGLRATPASAATVGELAFPLSALLVNWVAFGATLTLTQTVGLVALSGTLVVMSRAGRDDAADLGIEAPATTR
jgi:DME family drug/metabolite transporter